MSLQPQEPASVRGEESDHDLGSVVELKCMDYYSCAFHRWPTACILQRTR